MAFEYSESVYGVRTYGSSVGEVINASATVTATSSIANVNWVIAIGAEASLTATSTTTCSGEVVILEETDVHSYGSGLYGANEYTQGDLQTIISATSSIANVNYIRVRNAVGIVAAESATVTIGGFTANASGTITVTSATTCSGQKVGERSASLTSTSGVTSNATATYNDAITITATSSTTASASGFFLESSDKMVYGHGLYGMEVYDQADLQTIVSATSVGTTCTAAKVNLASATVSAVASITTASEKIHLSSGTVTATSTITSNSVIVVVGTALVSPSGTITTSALRVRESSGIVSVTSGTATIGREKWEIIAVTPITWTPVVNDSVTWTQIAA